MQPTPPQSPAVTAPPRGEAGRSGMTIQKRKEVLKMEKMCYIPKISSIENALRIYYENSYIGNKEIKVLFGELSSAKIAQLKNAVRKKISEMGRLQHSRTEVDVVVAYDVWGLDIEEIEKKYNKLKKLGML